MHSRNFKNPKPGKTVNNIYALPKSHSSLPFCNPPIVSQPCGEQSNCWGGYVPRYWARPVGLASIYPGKGTIIFSKHDEVVRSNNSSPKDDLSYWPRILLFLAVIPFHCPSVICVVKAWSPPETSWNRDDIIYHCPRKHCDSSILFPHYQITVVSLPINCACLCQPGLVLPRKFTVLGAVTQLPCQPLASLCHLHCPWTEHHQWGEAWFHIGQAQNHLSKLSGSQFSSGKRFAFRIENSFFPKALFFYICLSLLLQLFSITRYTFPFVSWCPEHLEIMLPEQYFLWTIKEKPSPFRADRNTLLAEQERSIEPDLLRRTESLARQWKIHGAWQVSALW